MAIDERSAEKEIAPFVSEEIDGRNLIRYKYGDKIELESDEISVASADGKFYEKLVALPLSSIISSKVVLRNKFKPSKETNLKWKILMGDEEINSLSLGVSKEQELLFNFSPKKDSFVLKQLLEKDNDSEVKADSNISIVLSYDKRTITAKDLNTPVFYVERLNLEKGDAVFFENIGNYFADKPYEFKRPIAVRSLHFLRGKPEVILYFLKKGSFDWREVNEK